VHLWSGRTATAVRRAEESLEAFREMGDVFTQTQAFAVLARSLALAGRVDDAHRVLDDAQRRLGDKVPPNMHLLLTTAAAAVSVDLGDPEEALARAGADISGLDPTILGQGDRIAAIGVALAQAGRLDEAYEVLGRAAREVPDAGRDPNALAALGLVVCARGDLDLALEIVRGVEDSPRATYIDHVLAALTEAFVAHRRGDVPASADCLVRARALVARTDDRVHAAVVAVAASVLDPRARAAADEHLRTLGIDAHGWFTLFRALRGA